MDQRTFDYNNKLEALQKKWEELRLLHNEEAGKPEDDRNVKKLMDIKTDMKVIEVRGLALKTAKEKHLKLL
jgi:uncharacterized protein (DUF4415 family)